MSILVQREYLQVLVDRFRACTKQRLCNVLVVPFIVQVAPTLLWGSMHVSAVGGGATRIVHFIAEHFRRQEVLCGFRAGGILSRVARIHDLALLSGDLTVHGNYYKPERNLVVKVFI